MDKTTQEELRRLGFRPGASGVRQCWVKTGQCMMYRNEGALTWRLSLSNTGQWKQAPVSFDDPVTAAVWLNVELAGE